MESHGVGRDKLAEGTKSAVTPAEAPVPEPTGAARAQAAEMQALLTDSGGSVEHVQLERQKPAAMQSKEARGLASSDAIKATAAQGLSGQAQELPYIEQIQAAFGPGHDLTQVRAHVGGPAAEAAGAIGATAYASGDAIAFGGAPDLRTAAHEAAHVVQQRQGVSLAAGVGRQGDSYEQNADAVAQRVVQGKSAADLLPLPGLDEVVEAAQATQMRVQFTGHRLDEPLPEGAETPAHAGGRKPTDQRQYSYEQYVEMWEAEHGRKMTDAEKETLDRGCIGITHLQLTTDKPNPPLDMAYGSFDQAHAEMVKLNEQIALHADRLLNNGKKLGEYQAVMFAKLFWSNQKEDLQARAESDPDAYKPDPKTGKVDMTGYRYRPRPKLDEEGKVTGKTYINFDYGFWDEGSQSFWHANHSQPGMKVYQSTKDKFAAGYFDFDRIIYCVWFALKYNPSGLASTHQ